jgi:hypothetical protein
MPDEIFAGNRFAITLEAVGCRSAKTTRAAT